MEKVQPGPPDTCPLPHPAPTTKKITPRRRHLLPPLTPAVLTGGTTVQKRHMGSSMSTPCARTCGAKRGGDRGAGTAWNSTEEQQPPWPIIKPAIKPTCTSPANVVCD